MNKAITVTVGEKQKKRQALAQRESEEHMVHKKLWFES